MTFFSRIKSLISKSWQDLGGDVQPPGSCDECWSVAWRPALQGYGPVRICSKCAYIDPLTMPEFYAQFGIMPYGGIVGKHKENL